MIIAARLSTVAVFVLLAGCGAAAGITAPPAAQSAPAGFAVAAVVAAPGVDYTVGLQSGAYRHACERPQPGYAACLVLVASESSRLAQASRTGNSLKTPAPTAVPSAKPTAAPTAKATPTPQPTVAPTAPPTSVAGYGPADFQKAYGTASVAATAGAGKIVAVVSVLDAPTLEADLAVYRAHYRLPACTTANGCFTKLAQNGTKTYAAANGGWAVETSLDVEMISANCPLCKIVVVEANSSAASDLAAAENMAASKAPVAITNSYVIGEWSGETGASYVAAYNHPGIAIVAASGDGGYGVGFPAVFGSVLAVGGTSLQPAANARGFTETAWSGSGAGCSAYVAKPAWQTDSGCTRRTVADISFSADPNHGVAIYDSTTLATGQVGWLVVGGTSGASPSIAAMFALGSTAALTNAPAYVAAHTASLYDIVSGSDGTCTPAYLCTAGVGYDGPTGFGSPNGLGAF